MRLGEEEAGRAALVAPPGDASAQEGNGGRLAQRFGGQSAAGAYIDNADLAASDTDSGDSVRKKPQAGTQWSRMRQEQHKQNW